VLTHSNPILAAAAKIPVSARKHHKEITGSQGKQAYYKQKRDGTQ